MKNLKALTTFLLVFAPAVHAGSMMSTTVHYAESAVNNQFVEQMNSLKDEDLLKVILYRLLPIEPKISIKILRSSPYEYVNGKFVLSPTVYISDGVRVARFFKDQVVDSQEFLNALVEYFSRPASEANSVKGFEITGIAFNRSKILLMNSTKLIPVERQDPKNFEILEKWDLFGN